MLSSKQATMVIKILSLCLVAALSFFVVTAKMPETTFVKSSMESVEESSDTVMKLSAATLSTALAISALPDDFATPLAQSLSDMNIYFIAILVILFLEKILVRYGIQLAFAVLIPLACLIGVISVLTKKTFLKGFAARLCALALALAFVVPCSTHVTNVVAADMAVYVDSTIQETEGGADKLNEAMKGGDETKTMFEKLSDLLQTAIRDMSDLLLHFQNTIRKCMNSIAILISIVVIVALLLIML